MNKWESGYMVLQYLSQMAGSNYLYTNTWVIADQHHTINYIIRNAHELQVRFMLCTVFNCN